MDAMKSIEKVLNIFAEEGNDLRHSSYYGLVIDNFECEGPLSVAVEVAGGNRLFQHVVATDQVATQLVKRINERKLPGSVTFMPLNKLQVSEIVYPKSEVSQCDVYAICHFVVCIKHNKLMFSFLGCPSVNKSFEI